MVLDKHAIVQQREAAGRLYGSIGSAGRSVKDNVERLPLAGRPASVHQRRRLSIKRGAGTIWGRLVLVIVQNLDLVQVLEYDAAVRARVALLVGLVRNVELHMDLRIVEFLGRSEEHTSEL